MTRENLSSGKVTTLRCYGFKKFEISSMFCCPWLRRCIGHFPDIQGSHSKPNGTRWFYCRSGVCDSIRAAQPVRHLSELCLPRFQEWGTGERDSSLSHLKLLALTSAQLSPVQWLCVVGFSPLLPFGYGLRLPGCKVASHSRAAFLFLRGRPSKLLASWSPPSLWLEIKNSRNDHEKIIASPTSPIFLRWLYGDSLVTLDFPSKGTQLWFCSVTTQTLSSIFI